MRARDLCIVAACTTLIACSRTQPAQPARPVARDAGPSLVDVIAPALLMARDASLPPIVDAGAPDAGPAERLVVNPSGSNARILSPRFTLEAGITRGVTPGTARWTLAIRGAGGTTVNAGYPITIELSADAVQITKPSIRRVDALTYTPQLARFQTELTDANSGETVVAEVLMSVCRGAECAFESRRVVLVVP